MSGAGYPRDRIDSILLTTALPDGYRIMPARYRASPLGTVAADSRFCTRNAGYTVLYAAPDFATAFIETVVRDRFVQRQERDIGLKEISERVWARIAGQPGTMLTLLDVRGDGCTVLGAPTDTVRARNHAAGRAFGRAIHAGHADIDGLLYVSRLTGGDVYAVFDRAVGKIESLETGALMDHPDLPETLERHGIGLVP